MRVYNLPLTVFTDVEYNINGYGFSILPLALLGGAGVAGIVPIVHSVRYETITSDAVPVAIGKEYRKQFSKLFISNIKNLSLIFVSLGLKLVVYETPEETHFGSERLLSVDYIGTIGSIAALPANPKWELEDYSLQNIVSGLPAVQVLNTLGAVGEERLYMAQITNWAIGTTDIYFGDATVAPNRHLMHFSNPSLTKDYIYKWRDTIWAIALGGGGNVTFTQFSVRK